MEEEEEERERGDREEEEGWHISYRLIMWAMRMTRRFTSATRRPRGAFASRHLTDEAAAAEAAAATMESVNVPSGQFQPTNILDASGQMMGKQY